ncbi:MAG: antibiotic biosynthesis monooxygenase [Chitinophagales bacterium]
MIARIWHGKTDKSNLVTYSEFLRKKAIPDYKKANGLQGMSFLRKVIGSEAHFTLITYWQNMDAIRAFAGNDIEKAKYYPEDKDFLLEFEEVVQHYEVFAP